MQLLTRKQLLLSYLAIETTTKILPSAKDHANQQDSSPSRNEWQAWAIEIRIATTAYLNDSSQTSSDDKNVTPGALIRLAFHDAVTGSPNGSIRYELDWSENRALSRPLAVVQTIHAATTTTVDTETDAAANSRVGSLADTLALVAAQSIEYTGGPHVAVKLGRPDSTTADPYLLEKTFAKETKRSIATKIMPDAGLNSHGLRLYFGRLGLAEEEFVALSGIHGLGRHVSLLGMEKNCLKNLTRTCLEEAPVLLPFVTSSTDRFSNAYFKALLRWNAQNIEMGEVAFIPTDVALVVDPGLRRHVQAFASNERLYTKTFIRAWQILVESTATTLERY
eukprot:scaffold2448_cov155-Amphora_coffeaeformis.AAC.5